MKTSATRRCTAGAGTIPVVTTPAGLPCAAPGTSTRLVWGPVLRRDDVRVHQPRTTEWRLADPRRPGASRHPSPPRPPPVNRDPDSRVRRPAPPVPPTTLGRDPGACLPYGGHPGRGRLGSRGSPGPPCAKIPSSSGLGRIGGLDKPFHHRYTVCSWLTSAKVRVCEVGEGSAALIQSTNGCLYRRIRAARLSMIVGPGIVCPGHGRARSCRPGMVLMDQPTEDLPPLDRVGPRRPRAWDRAVDIVRTTKIQPAVRSMRVVMAGILAQEA